MEGLRVCNIFLDTTMAKRRRKKKKLGQFLLIQQFWLMGTTSIPQPVITTAQFPISTWLARKSSSGCQFSAISQLVLNLFLESTQADTQGGAHLRPCNRWHGSGAKPVARTTAAFRMSWMWEKRSRRRRTREANHFDSFCSIPCPRLWLTACARLGGRTQSPGNWPFPFPRMSLGSAEDLCHVREGPWDSLKSKLPLSERLEKWKCRGLAEHFSSRNP